LPPRRSADRVCVERMASDEPLFITRHTHICGRGHEQGKEPSAHTHAHTHTHTRTHTHTHTHTHRHRNTYSSPHTPHTLTLTVRIVLTLTLLSRPLHEQRI